MFFSIKRLQEALARISLSEVIYRRGVKGCDREERFRKFLVQVHTTDMLVMKCGHAHDYTHL